MNYPDYLKIEAVKIYSNTRNVDATLDEIRDRHHAVVSRRSLFLWVKDPRYRDPDNSPAPTLFLDLTEYSKRAEAKKKAFNVADLVEANKQFFVKSNEKLDKIIRTITNDLQPEEVKKLSTKDKISALCKLEGLKIKKHEFLLSLLATAGENGEGLEKALATLAADLNGIEDETIDAEVVKEGAE